MARLERLVGSFRFMSVERVYHMDMDGRSNGDARARH